MSSASENTCLRLSDSALLGVLASGGRGGVPLYILESATSTSPLGFSMHSLNIASTIRSVSDCAPCPCVPRGTSGSAAVVLEGLLGE